MALQLLKSALTGGVINAARDKITQNSTASNSAAGLANSLGMLNSLTGVQSISQGDKVGSMSKSSPQERAQKEAAKTAVAGMVTPLVSAQKQAAETAAKTAVAGGVIGTGKADEGKKNTETKNTDTKKETKAEEPASTATEPVEDTSGGVSLGDFGLIGGGGGFSYPDFGVSDAYTQAMNYTNSLLSQMSTGRTSYSDQIDALIKEYQNREKFSYDMNADPLFQQMLASSMNSGKMAMQDTIGQAAALTGGYGNTYGQAVGNAAYNQYITEAYENLPDYYNLALDAYNMEGEQMLAELDMLRDADNTEYGRLVNAYNANYNYANDMYDREYTEYLNDRNFEYDNYWSEKNFNYNAYQDALAQQNWEKQFNYNASQDALAQQNWQTQFDYNAAQDQKEWEYTYAMDAFDALTGGSAAIPTLTNTEINAIKEIGAIYGTGAAAENAVNSYLNGIGKNPSGGTPEAIAFFNAIDGFLAEGKDGNIYDTIYGTDTSLSAQNKYWEEILKKR